MTQDADVCLSTTISLLLVEDHPVVVHGMRAICADQPGLVVCGCVNNATDALESAARLQPDLVVLPVRLGGTRGGVELCRAVKSVCTARVVVFTSFTRDIDIHVAMLAGADAIISKSAQPQEIVDALRQATTGRRRLLHGMGVTPSAYVEKFATSAPLTERENEILHLLIEGLINPEIATRLNIELSTVKTHVRNILRKLAVDTRRDLFSERSRLRDLCPDGESIISNQIRTWG